MEEYKTVTKPEKKKLSRKKLILCVLAMLIVGGVALYFIATANRNISQELLKDESQTVLDYMNAMGAKYGISFTKVTMERDEHPHIYAYSANYAAASEKDRLDLLVRIADDLGYTGTLELANGTKLEMTKGVWPDLYIVSGGHEYSLYDKRYSTGCAELMSDYDTVYEAKYQEIYHAEDKNKDKGGGSGSTREKVPCSMCNGTGKVRYYYGGSATEAAMNGKNDYEYGPCTSCNGTGYQYVDVKPGSSDSGSVICPGCGKRVSKLISKKDAAGVVRNWCSSCWADYNAIMGG